MTDEDEIVILGEVLEEQTQLAQVVEVHEVGVVEDGRDRLAGVVEAESLFDEPAFALEGGSFEFDAESVAEDFDGVGVSVQRSGNGGDEMLVFGKALQGLLDDAFAGPGQPEDEAEASLLAMDLERIVNLLLQREQFEFACVKRILGQPVESSDHYCWSFRRLSPLATASSNRATPMRWPLW